MAFFFVSTLYFTEVPLVNALVIEQRNVFTTDKIGECPGKCLFPLLKIRLIPAYVITARASMRNPRAIL